jgi:hypothetical protein
MVNPFSDVLGPMLAAGSCAAIGTYTGGQVDTFPFVVSEVNGTWGTAARIAGIGAIDMGFSGAGPVLCATPGNRALAGDYFGASGARQAFVASQAHRTWGRALEVPGIAALNAGGAASVLAVSCFVPGRCAVGGTYADGAGHAQVFMVSEG